MKARLAKPSYSLAAAPFLIACAMWIGITGAHSAEKSTTEKAPMVAGEFCTNIKDAASEARAAFRLKKLKEVEKQIEDRIAALEEKSQEIKSWLERRENFIEKAQNQLVDIYKLMRPDAAALQISALDEMTAAAILLKLKPRTASTILNEMDPKMAARLASFVSYAAKKAGKKGKS